jgi:hypothetical protein
MVRMVKLVLSPRASIVRVPTWLEGVPIGTTTKTSKTEILFVVKMTVLGEHETGQPRSMTGMIVAYSLSPGTLSRKRAPWIVTAPGLTFVGLAIIAEYSMVSVIAGMGFGLGLGPGRASAMDVRPPKARMATARKAVAAKWALNRIRIVYESPEIICFWCAIFTY